MRLTDYRVIYICPDHNQKYKARKIHMEKLLRDVGFTNIEHYKSSTENYPDCLVNATIDIFRKNLDEPFLLIEDDVEFTGEMEFNVDSGVDAIYLGISRYGGSKVINKWEGFCKTEPYSDTQVRVLNMLTTHAILYLTRRYKEAIIDVLQQNIGRGYYNDVLISRIQSNYQVLANKKPSFFQSAKFNVPHLEYATRFTIE